MTVWFISTNGSTSSVHATRKRFQESYPKEITGVLTPKQIDKDIIYKLLSASEDGTKTVFRNPHSQKVPFKDLPDNAKSVWRRYKQLVLSSDGKVSQLVDMASEFKFLLHPNLVWNDRTNICTRIGKNRSWPTKMETINITGQRNEEYFRKKNYRHMIIALHTPSTDMNAARHHTEFDYDDQ